MEIRQLKEQLSIKQVLDHYGLKPNRNQMLHCPFHEDKTASMQVYPETNTVFCFSGNCGQTGKAIDQIDFILHKEGCTKHQAINKAKTLLGATAAGTPTNTLHLDEVFHQLKANLPNSRKATAYLKRRGLYDMKLEIGSNHKSHINGKTGYHYPHLRDCVIFPLKDPSGHVVSLYGRSLRNGHYYLANRKGLYPGYPGPDTQTIVFTESILDAATINKYTDYQALALYGTHGLTNEHIEALHQLKALQEVILFFDGDEAGAKATAKYSKQLHEQFLPITISQIATPAGEDPNSLIQSHEPALLSRLIEARTILFSATAHPSTAKERLSSAQLDTTHPAYLTWRKDPLLITILGGLGWYPLDKLKVTLKIERTDSRSPLHSIRYSLDLYHDDQSEKLILKAAERLETGSREMQLAIAALTQALENYRSEQIAKQQPKQPEKRILTAARERNAIQFLKRTDLMEATDQLIEQSGVVGEKINRQILWYVYTTRLREQPLHVICLGASGSGKTYLQERVSELIPEEDKVSGTSISENALYYAQDLQLPHKLFIIEDLDGASHVLYALRELQTKSSIRKIVTHKDNKGNMKTIIVEVAGPICLTGTTTKERLYEDNANRCLLLYLDGSPQQHEAIMAHQRKRSAGKINKQQVEEAREFLRDVQSVLHPIAVRNPYAEQLQIPETVFKPLRTHAHYLGFIEAITFYHQYQREVKTDPDTGERYIETSLSDIAGANVLLKEVLLAKSDELTKACRDFFEVLKRHVSHAQQTSFYRGEVRHWLRINPHTLRYYLKQLVQYGYLHVLGRHKHHGHEYEITNLEEYHKLHGSLCSVLDQALSRIKGGDNGDNRVIVG